MSVLKCSRRNCNEVMCSCLFQGKYICHSCKQELETVIEAIPPGLTQHQINEILAKFWNTPPGSSTVCDDPKAYTRDMFQDQED